MSVNTSASASSFGQFVLRAYFNAPSGLGNFNNEGLTLAPELECSATNTRRAFWSDDADTGGNSLRVGAVSCGAPF